jgi:hypothetical protein
MTFYSSPPLRSPLKNHLQPLPMQTLIISVKQIFIKPDIVGLCRCGIHTVSAGRQAGTTHDLRMMATCSPENPADSFHQILSVSHLLSGTVQALNVRHGSVLVEAMPDFLQFQV